jgi:hypothetical protein
MNDLDMTFETFAAEVLHSTSYGFTDAELREFYEDGYTTFDTIEWAEDKLDDDLFG